MAWIQEQKMPLHLHVGREKKVMFDQVCFAQHWRSLEQRQYKNDSIQSKVIPTLNLPRFSTTYTVREKGGNFKIGVIFDWMESFLFCLCSRSQGHYIWVRANDDEKSTCSSNALKTLLGMLKSVMTRDIRSCQKYFQNVSTSL